MNNGRLLNFIGLCTCFLPLLILNGFGTVLFHSVKWEEFSVRIFCKILLMMTNNSVLLICSKFLLAKSVLSTNGTHQMNDETSIKSQSFYNQMIDFVSSNPILYSIMLNIVFAFFLIRTTFPEQGKCKKFTSIFCSISIKDNSLRQDVFHVFPSGWVSASKWCQDSKWLESFI